MIPPRRGMNLNNLNTKMNTKVLLSCANGNSLIGAPEITCLPSGNWSAPIPICESKCTPQNPFACCFPKVNPTGINLLHGSRLYYISMQWSEKSSFE
jgi:hypothetical protein